MRPTKQESLVDISDFEDEDLEQEAMDRDRDKRVMHITERDVKLIVFLGRYGFATAAALARLVGTSVDAVAKRLRLLETHGLVLREDARVAVLWHASREGMRAVGLSFDEKQGISLATVHHTIAISELAAELEAEHLQADDVLGIRAMGEAFPPRRRPAGGGRQDDGNGFVFGELTVSEREIRQAQERNRVGSSTLAARAAVRAAASDPSAPELDEGAEDHFVVYGRGGKTGEHVPDLVVLRPRAADGSLRHVAIEFERTAKKPGELRRILTAFAEEGSMYAHVVYFTPTSAMRNVLLHAGEQAGLGEKLTVRKYSPTTLRKRRE